MEKIKKLKDYSSLIKETGGKCAVTSHTIPDPDAIASCIGVAYYLGCDIVVHDFLRSDSKRTFQLAKEANIVKGYKVMDNLDEYDHIIVVDASSKVLLPQLNDRIVDLVIDHHITPKGMIKYKEAYIRNDATSATELLLDMIDYNDIPQRLAAIFMIGIITDTARFSQGTSETFDKFNRLLGISDISYNKLIEFINEPLPFGERKLILDTIISSDVDYLKNDMILTVSKCKSHESIISSMFKDAGADLAIAYVLSKDGVRLSARLATYLKHKIILPKLMDEVGKLLGGSGGGHPLAAGADGPKKDKIDDAIRYIMSELNNIE
ncbi:DHH family phosphoesterase [Candidatus Micrarchaeota archaeon]|nr:DHH family phosphoesterase [Candidatus Micrarchaeota archaeon]